MLLAYVALKEGDEVGAMTFGNAPGQRRDFAPRKGGATLNALMNRLYDLEPGPRTPTTCRRRATCCGAAPPRPGDRADQLPRRGRRRAAPASS
jgi:uncharacterized protein (DUF58 family)